MRRADGPMSTPRRPAAEVERDADDVDGLHGRGHRRFHDTDMPSPDGATIVVNSVGLRLDRREEVRHLAPLVDHVVARGTGRPASSRGNTRSKNLL